MQDLQPLREALSQAQRILVFTGAGMSTGSGIRDFRGPQGIWKQRRPVMIDEFLSSHEARLEYWDYKHEGYESFRLAQPNAAHRALAELELQGRLQGIVTQNVDGLHSLAGNSDTKLIELHGTNRKITCMSCQKMSKPSLAFAEWEKTKSPPVCGHCGGWLKPATISFGQALVEEDLTRAFQWAAVCDFVMSLGSTLSVQPASSVPTSAPEDAPYLVINQGPTEHDHVCDFRLDGDLVSVVPALLEDPSL